MRLEFETGKLNHCWTKEDISVKSISFGTRSREIWQFCESLVCVNKASLL